MGCLLEQGADVGLEDEVGNTAAIVAARAGHLKVVRLLAERGADLDHENAAGESARGIVNEMMDF